MENAKSWKIFTQCTLKVAGMLSRLVEGVPPGERIGQSSGADHIGL